MALENNDIEYLLHMAQEAAIAAGLYIAEVTDNNVEVQKKVGGESVASQVFTEVDLQCQEIIIEHLQQVSEAFSISILAEETADDGARFSTDYFWCIDPLDGTLAFINKEPGYSVSISLVSKEGEPIIGVVFDPLRMNLYYAAKGLGVFKNGEPLEKPKDTTDTVLHVYADRSFHSHADFPVVLEKLHNFLPDFGCKTIEVYATAGAAMNACMLLENAKGVYFKFPRPNRGGGSLWDYAASACIFQEAGLYAKDIYGDALDLNRKDCTFMNHKGILYATNERFAKQITQMYTSLFS